MVDEPPPTPLPSAKGPAPSMVSSNPLSKIKAFTEHSSAHTSNFKRATHITGSGICRVRSFHGRLSEEGLAFLDNKINEWLDSHADIEAKFITTTIGTFEGKLKEPAMVINIWY
jgi:hypothetical protein